jgi:hypothetical protein
MRGLQLDELHRILIGADFCCAAEDVPVVVEAVLNVEPGLDSIIWDRGLANPRRHLPLPATQG